MTDNETVHELEGFAALITPLDEAGREHAEPCIINGLRGHRIGFRLRESWPNIKVDGPEVDYYSLVPPKRLLSMEMTLPRTHEGGVPLGRGRVELWTPRTSGDGTRAVWYPYLHFVLHEMDVTEPATGGVAGKQFDADWAGRGWFYERAHDLPGGLQE